MAVGARNVRAIDRATGRSVCVCERPLPTRDEDADVVACLKCGRGIVAPPNEEFERFEALATGLLSPKGEWS